MPEVILEDEGRKFSRRAFLAVLGTSIGAVAVGAPVLRAETPIKVGVLAPLLLDVGTATARGAHIAAEEINAQGGILGHPLELEIADDGLFPYSAVTAFSGLVTTKTVSFVVGGFLDEVMLALMSDISRFGIIFLDTGSLSPGTNNLVASEYDRFKFYFRVMLNTKVIAQDMERFADKFLKRQMGFKKLALLMEDVNTGRDLQTALESRLPGVGIDVAFSQRFASGMRDFSPIFPQIEESGAQAIILAVGFNDGLGFVSQWWDRKFPAPVFGINVQGQAFEYWQASLGKVLSHVYIHAVLGRAAVTEKTLPFVQKYTQIYKDRPVQPLYTAFTTYDALFILKAAIEKTQITDAEQLITALEQTSWIGTTGKLEFRDRNDPYPHELKYGDEFVVPQYAQWRENGGREIIWPPQFKTADYVPPPWM
jgi:branched-chain amino acid transport system substrate-binding protein